MLPPPFTPSSLRAPWPSHLTITSLPSFSPSRPNCPTLARPRPLSRATSSQHPTAYSSLLLSLLSVPPPTRPGRPAHRPTNFLLLGASLKSLSLTSTTPHPHSYPFLLASASSSSGGRCSDCGGLGSPVRVGPPARARIRRVGPGVGGESRGLRWRAAFEGGRGATCGAGRIEECIAAIEAGA